MSKDPSAPAARKALKYKAGTDPGGGLPAADITAEQAEAWYTAAQVQEALDLGSHELASDEEAAKMSESAQARQTRDRQAARRAVERQRAGQAVPPKEGNA